MGSIVVKEGEKEFEAVEWGRTKNLFGPESGGTKYLKINISEYAPGSGHNLHMHPGQEEVIFILDGEGVTKTDKGDVSVRAGSCIFVPADAHHATFNVLKDKPLKALIIKSPPDGGKREISLE
jgi:mannose-6-phosphate isomerase-like protein (cupin superfamily)